MSDTSKTLATAIAKATRVQLPHGLTAYILSDEIKQLAVEELASPAAQVEYNVQFHRRDITKVSGVVSIPADTPKDEIHDAIRDNIDAMNDVEETLFECGDRCEGTLVYAPKN